MYIRDNDLLRTTNASASLGEDPFSKAKHKEHHVLLRDCTRHGKNVDRRFASHSLTWGSPANSRYNECSVVKAWPITKRATMSYDITYSTVGSLNTVLHFNTSCCGSQSRVCGGSDVCLVAAEALQTWSWVTCHWKGKLFRSARTWSQNPTTQFRNLSPLRIPRYQNWIVDSGSGYEPLISPNLPLSASWSHLAFVFEHPVYSGWSQSSRASRIAPPTAASLVQHWIRWVVVATLLSAAPTEIYKHGWPSHSFKRNKSQPVNPKNEPKTKKSQKIQRNSKSPQTLFLFSWGPPFVPSSSFCSVNMEAETATPTDVGTAKTNRQPPNSYSDTAAPTAIGPTPAKRRSCAEPAKRGSSAAPRRARPKTTSFSPKVCLMGNHKKTGKTMEMKDKTDKT